MVKPKIEIQDIEHIPWRLTRGGGNIIDIFSCFGLHPYDWIGRVRKVCR
jgi:hypothetical protein